MGAEKLIAAERDSAKIAVEIKSFLDSSPVRELEKALGQYELYSLIMEDEEPGRVLYLAVNKMIIEGFFAEEIAQRVLRKKNLRLIIFEPDAQEIIQWIT